MYTIRQILGATLGLTRSGVRWNLDSINGFNGNQDTRTPDQLLDRAKELIQGIKDKDSYSVTDFLRVNELKNITTQLGKTNVEKRDTIMNDVAAAADDQSLSPDDRARFQKLHDEWNKEYKNVDIVAGVPVEQSPVPVETRTSIQSGTEAKATPGAAPATIEVRPLPVDGPREQLKAATSSLRDNISLLADLNNDSKIDASLRDVVNEDVLKKALSRVTEGGKEDKVKEVYQKVTGKDVSIPLSPESIKEFQTKLRTSLVMIQKLTGGNAGLYGLLTGQLEKYAAQVKKLNPKPEVKVDEMKGLTPEMQNLIGSLATAGVLIITGGVVMVGHSAETATAESVLKDLDRSTLGKAWDWIKEAFTGGRLALSFGQDKMSVTEYKDKIRDFAQEIMSGGIKTPIAKEIYTTASKIATDLGMANNEDAIRKAAIQAYVQNLGVENAGSDWTAKIGLLFIGANRDAIDPTILATKYSQFNEIEAGLTKRKLTSAELTSAGVKIEKIDGGKYKHTIPDAVKLAGDDEPLPVVKPQGVNLETADQVYDLHFSDKDGKYMLTATPRNPQPTGNDILPSGDVSGRQSVDTVRNAREKKEKLDKNQLATMLYNVVGHSKPELFGPLLSAIKTRDPAEIDAAITKIEKSGYKTLAKMLQKDKANFEMWTTYMYGTKDTRMNDNPAQEGVDKLRKSDVIAAENRLAKAAGITQTTSENQFAIGKGEKHSPTQVSEKFPGQEMTVSVFATPKGGQHRIDAFDGSIAMSQKYVELSDAYKNQVIDATLNDSGKGGIRSQFDKLNAFLKENNKTQIDGIQKYVDYLKTGYISKLGVPELQLQDGKGTKVFEGRAMVAGNVCMNRMHGIVYPAFQLADGDRQAITPVGTMDATAQLNAMGVSLEKSSVGGSVLGAAARLLKHGGSSGGGLTSNTIPGVGGGSGANGVSSVAGF